MLALKQSVHRVCCNPHDHGKDPACWQDLLPCLAQVYMDSRVTTNEDGTQHILPAGDPIFADASWEVNVTAYAIQADGFNIGG